MKLNDLAQVCEAKLEGDGDLEINDVARVEDAKRDQLCFIANKKYLPKLEKSQPGAIIAAPGMALPQGSNVLRAADPDLAFSKALTALRGESMRPLPGIGENVVMGEHLDMGENTSIGAFCVLGTDVKLGKNVIIYPHCYIGDNVSIGDDSIIYPNVTLLENCTVGRRCVLHPGVVLGADGFGFHFVAGKFVKAPQRGRVELGDDVEVGANTTVDRARFDVTSIKTGTKLDNLVMIAHNVNIGQHCVIAAQTGIAGSSVLKDYVRMGGAVGVGDHLTIGMGAQVAARAGIMQDIGPGMKMAGAPAIEGRNFMRQQAALRKLPELLGKFRDMQAKINELEDRLEGKTPPPSTRDDEPAPGPRRKTGLYRPKPLPADEALRKEAAEGDAPKEESKDADKS